MNIFALCTAVLTALYGLITLLRGKTPLFYQTVVFGSWCYLLAVVYRVLYAILIPTPAFHAGYLGYAGTFFFLLSAYFSHANEKHGQTGVFSPVALIPPLVILVWGGWNMHQGYGILPQLLLLPVVLTAYFSCRQLMEKTTSAIALRPYNAAVLALCLLQPIMLVAMLTREHTAVPILITSVLSVATVVLADRGCRKWSM